MNNLADKEKFDNFAKELAELCKKHKVSLVANDYVIEVQKEYINDIDIMIEELLNKIFN